MPHIPQEFRSAPWRNSRGEVSYLKLAIFVLMFFPAIQMTYSVLAEIYWPRPIVDVIYWTGIWATVFLLLALFVTPLRKMFRWNSVISVRRMIGISALAYTVGHIAAFVVLREFAMIEVIVESFTRPSVLLGTLSFIGLIVLGMTSFDDVIRRMGAEKWNRLHKSIYLLTALALVHFLMSPGAAAGLPILFAVLFVWLLVWRWLDRRGLGANVPILFALGFASILVTVGFEMFWSWAVHDLDPFMMFEFNFNRTLGTPASWYMSALGLGVPVSLWLYRSLRPALRRPAD